jgi:flavodoxin I
MTKIAIVYGSTTGNTADVAQRIAQALNTPNPIDVLEVSQLSPDQLTLYDFLILGTSTWGSGDLQDDWEYNLRIITPQTIQNKTIALFALGDQQAYSDTFVDGMGILYEHVIAAGAKVIGVWPAKGYEHTHSKASLNDCFVGLALDEDNQAELSQERIDEWCKQISRSIIS